VVDPGGGATGVRHPFFFGYRTLNVHVNLRKLAPAPPPPYFQIYRLRPLYFQILDPGLFTYNVANVHEES